VFRAATDSQAEGGDYYGPADRARPGLAPQVQYAKTAHEEQLAIRRWQASEALTGVSFPPQSRS
jgi:hypothetical protein